MGKRPLGSRRVLASVLGLGVVCGKPVAAQTLEIPEAPSRSMLDDRNVDLMSGQTIIDRPVLNIGNGANGLAHSLFWPGLYGFRHDHMITALVDDYYQDGTHVTISFGRASSGFTWNGSVYVSDKGDGSTLSLDQSKSNWTYTDRDGVVFELDRTLGSDHTYANTINYYGAIDAVATLISRPDGHKVRLAYKRRSYYYSGEGLSGTVYPVRLQSVTNSSGYQLKFGYRSNTLTQAMADDWASFAKVSAINNAVDYCDPAADVCTDLSQSWPTAYYEVATSGTDSILAITDPAGRISRYIVDNLGRMIGFRRPSATSNSITYGYYPNSSAVSSVTVAGVGTWNYTFSLDSSTAILSGTVTTPTVSTPMSFTANYGTRQPLTITNENSRTTTYTYDSYGRLKTTTPHGAGSNYSTYNYDTRGNLVSQVVTPKNGSGLGTLTTSASYPASCSNEATCNKPVTTTNSAGKITNYFYNANGTLSYVQAPAPAAGAARPETHFSYGNVQASVKNASGATLSDIVSMPTVSTVCRTSAWPCAASDQIVNQLTYTGTSAKNLLPTSSIIKAGSGSPSSTTSFAYDNIGDRTSVTNPVGNMTSFTYAADRQLLSSVGPSIDGQSGSRRRGIVYHYNSDGLRDWTAFGSVNPDGSVFTARRREYTDYDIVGRKVKVRLTDGSSNFAVTQHSYNGAGRPDCMVQRMNPATFASPPAACTLGIQGSFGPDRITRKLWTPAGALERIQSAYGVVGTQIDEIIYTYTSHGLVETLKDAKGNLTAFVYDGHDRLLRTCYNATLSACQSGSATDYEQLTYDSAGRQTQRSLRKQPTVKIVSDYDDLNRVKHVTYPGGGTFNQPVDYQYDNMGRMLSAMDGLGHSATFSYDALGNIVSQGDEISSRTMQYDAAGRRTRLTWSDGLYVTYEYNGASDLKAIREYGTKALVTFDYDDVGRRTSLTRGNGVVTNYNNYSVLGLGSLTNDLADTYHDQTLAFTYSPAGQIATRTLSNDAYAWKGAYNVNRNYTTNSLNQYTASGSIVPTYDTRGNLTSAGTPMAGSGP